MNTMLKTWYIKRVQNRLAAHFKVNCQRIDPAKLVTGAMRYNYRCHENAAHEATLNDDLRVVLCYTIENASGFGFLHVINRLPSGKFQDNTLGYLHAQHQYFFIKDALPDTYGCIAHWFDDHRQDFIQLHGKRWICRLLGIKPTDIF